jgi:hypothetical protein
LIVALFDVFLFFCSLGFIRLLFFSVSCDMGLAPRMETESVAHGVRPSRLDRNRMLTSALWYDIRHALELFSWSQSPNAHVYDYSSAAMRKKNTSKAYMSI